MEISSEQIGSGEIGTPEVGVAEVDTFEVDFTEIKDGSSMRASPLVPGLGSLLEQFKVLLVCHLDHLLVDPIGIHLFTDHEFTPLKYTPGITSIVDSIDPDAIIAQRCHSTITDDAGRHHKHLAIPQLVPLAEFFSWMRPAIWFCHVDTAHPNPAAQQYIRQFLDPYALACFNSQASVFKELPPEQAQVVTLGIDPFRVKNRFLPRARGMQILASCGIDTARPLITQVSRFGVWKNPWQVIDIYRQVKQQLPSAQLALVGALEAKDDIKAQEILTDLQQHAVHGDPDIHLLSDPTIINHEAVNAFQRYSSVILQRSIREGFGLTVTEAMWKKQPVIGTCVTGLQMQIAHGSNGYLFDDTETAVAYTLQLLQDRELWRELGENAYETVRQRFLFPTMILDYLKALARAQTGLSALIEPEIVPIRMAATGKELAA